MSLGDLGDNKESESNSLVHVCALRWIEQMLYLFGGHTYPGIRDGNGYLVIREACAHRDRGGGSAVLDGIRQKVIDDPREGCRIDCDLTYFGIQIELHRGARRCAKLLHNLCNKSVEVLGRLRNRAVPAKELLPQERIVCEVHGVLKEIAEPLQRLGAILEGVVKLVELKFHEPKRVLEIVKEVGERAKQGWGGGRHAGSGKISLAPTITRLLNGGKSGVEGDGTMEIYRFFHPHHNPRLHSVALRQQELFELEQVAAELRKALERARERSRRRPASPILAEHFDGIMKAVRFVEDSLKTLSDAHPGDSVDALRALVQEREDFSGWDTWCRVLQQQMAACPDDPTLLPRAGEPGQ